MQTNPHPPVLYRLLFTVARRLVVDSPLGNASPPASAPTSPRQTYESRHATARPATHAPPHSED